MARPYIGPKMQAHIPTKIALLIQQRALQEGIPEADALREVVEAGAPIIFKRELKATHA